MTKHYKRWSAEDDEYLRQHYTADGVESCAKHLERSKNATWNRTQSLGLRRERQHPEHIRMERIKTPVFAYVLGYLWADGSLTKHSYGVCLAIAHEDGLAIKSHMDYTGNWRQRKAQRRRPNHKDKYVYTVWDRRFVRLLRDLGFADKNHRCFDLVCQYLGPDLIPYFVHGFFDGDGCIASTTDVKIYTITFAAPLGYDWSYLDSVLKAAGIRTITVYESRRGKKGGWSNLYFRRQEDVLRFYRVFIHHPEVGLERKRVRFEEQAQKVAAKYREGRAFGRSSSGKYIAFGSKGTAVSLGHYQTREEAQTVVDEWEKANRPDLVQKRAAIREDLAYVGLGPETKESFRVHRHNCAHQKELAEHNRLCL